MPTTTQPPPIKLKPLTTEMLADLQRMYEASRKYFITFTSHPASTIQAVNDYQQMLESDDRAIMAIWWQDEQLIGALDFRFHHPVENVVWLGALILQDQTPGEREEIATWSVNILEEWLRIASPTIELRTSVPLNDAEWMRFWKKLGFKLSPEPLRNHIAGKNIRFGIFKKKITRE